MEFSSRSEVPEQYCWDLNPLFPDLDSWKKEVGNLENTLSEIEKYRGRLSESANTLYRAFQCYFSTVRKLERVYSYAHLRSDENTADAINLGFKETAANLFARFAAASSFLTPELIEISDDEMDRFLSQSELSEYARSIRETIRYKPHTRSSSEELLLAQGAEVFATSNRTFSQLNNADLSFGEIVVDGQPRALTHGSFVVFLKNPALAIRQKAWEQYYDVYDRHRNTIAATLSGSIRKDVYLAKAKRFDSALAASLFDDNMPTDVYNNLLQTVRESYPSFHRYLKLRKTLLKLPKQSTWDLYLPLAEDVKLRHSFEEAAGVVADALHPLGTEYCSALRSGMLEKRWVDVFESPGKRSGAYHSGCYDGPPYMLLNFKAEELGDVFTLAHEAGHAMHSYLTWRNQNYQDHHYTIFVAEVASTFNEQLLLAHLRKVYANRPDILRYLISHQLDEIRNTLFRQTLFADFEKRTHELVESNQPLTANEFKIIYSSLLEEYFGGEVDIPQKQWLECLRIPHFYSAFYVYKYATGVSASIALAEDVMNNTPGALDRYLSFLKAGCSKHPLDLLCDAGVDMRSPEPIKKAIAVFDKLTSELEALR